VNLVGYFSLLLLSACGAVAQSRPAVELLQPREIQPVITTNAVIASNSSAESLREEGNKFYDADQYELAIKAFSRLLAKKTNDADALWQLGSSYYMKDDMEHAAEAYARYVKLRPEIFEGHLWVGICWSRSEEFEKAEPELREAVRLRPNDPSAHDELGYCLKSLDRYAEAGAEFHRAIKYGGETAYRCTQGGYSYADARDFVNAIPLLERGAALERTNVDTYDWLGWSYFNTGK
jgi:Flp pilus assembly protein TadD